MSGIIDAEPFGEVFPQVRDDSTIQGVVTAIYELGVLQWLVGLLGTAGLTWSSCRMSRWSLVYPRCW